MDYKNVAANFALIQGVLAASGILAPRATPPKFPIGYYGVAVVLLMSVGVGLVLAGLAMYLGTIMPLYQVCLILGGVLFCLGAVIFGIRALMLYLLQRRIRRSVSSLYQDLKDAFGEVAGELQNPIEENPKIAALIALIAGFILGKKLVD